MKKLEEKETSIIGGFKEVNGELIADKNWNRINYLIETSLDYITDDDSGWVKLYRDEFGLFWELTYINGEIYGGGAPSLLKQEYKDKKIFFKKYKNQ